MWQGAMETGMAEHYNQSSLPLKTEAADPSKAPLDSLNAPEDQKRAPE